VAGLLIAARWSRRGQELPGILTCALTGLLVCPVSWEHHWVWAAPAIVLAADAVARLWRPGEVAPAFPGGPRRAALLRHRWAWLAAAALLAVPFFADPPSIVPASAVQGYGDHGTQLLAGNIYVIAGLVILGLAGLALAGSRQVALPPRAGTAQRVRATV
jgi:alpha-1,2-mannosyltransferase